MNFLICAVISLAWIESTWTGFWNVVCYACACNRVCVCVCLVLEMMLDMFAVFKLNTIHIFG